MESQLSEVISLTVYKLGCLVAGVLCVYMGYKLFVKGVWGNAGDIKANYEDTSIVIKSAAPGTIFAIVGLFIICFTVVVGLEFPKESETIEVLDDVESIGEIKALPSLPEQK